MAILVLMESNKKNRFWPLPNCRYCLGWGGWDNADSSGIYWEVCGACEGDGIDYEFKNKKAVNGEENETN